MSWPDELRQAAYTTPTGERLVFTYEDVSSEKQFRGTAFEFPDAEGTLVQRTGVSSRRMPLTVIIWGDNYLADAAQFEAALAVPGVGVLEHPVYGRQEVTPLGVVRREDALVSGANQALISVEFFSTIGVVYPSSQQDPATEVRVSVEDYTQQSATEFAEQVNLGTTESKVLFTGPFQALLDNTRTGLLAVAQTEEAVENQFNTVYDSINTSIDILVSDPLTLAFQTSRLIQVPATAADAIANRLQAYRALAEAIIGGNGANVATSNDFQSQDLYAMGHVASSVLAVTNADFQTKAEALNAADSLLSLLDEVVVWRDDNYVRLDTTDLGASYQQLQNAVALAAGFLVQISFSLKQERRITLVKNRCTVELVAELYGQVDEVLDFFAQSNNLSWLEHLEICAGRQIVYYV